MNIVFLGPPGAGKGTQAQEICEQLSLPHISTGQMLREAAASGSKVGLEAKRFMDGGNLVPDDIMLDIVKERLAEPDCEKGYLLDGFPRNIYQAEQLEQFAKIDNVINIELDDEVIVKRLSGRRFCKDCGHTSHLHMVDDVNECPACGGQLIQRVDDAPSAVKHRIEVYHKQTKPLVDFYAAKGLLRPIRGEQTVWQVREDILKALGIKISWRHSVYDFY